MEIVKYLLDLRNLFTNARNRSEVKYGIAPQLHDSLLECHPRVIISLRDLSFTIIFQLHQKKQRTSMLLHQQESLRPLQKLVRR